MEKQNTRDAYKSLKIELLKHYREVFDNQEKSNDELREFVKSYISPLVQAPSGYEWPHDFEKPESVELFGRKILGERFSQASIDEAPFIRSRAIPFPESPQEFSETLLKFLSEGVLPAVKTQATTTERRAHGASENMRSKSSMESRAFMQEIHRATNLLELERIRMRVTTQYEGIEPGKPNVLGLALMSELNTSAERLFRRYFAAEMTPREVKELRSYLVHFYEVPSMEKFAKTKSDLLAMVDEKVYTEFSQRIVRAETLGACAQISRSISLFYGKIGEGMSNDTKAALYSGVRRRAYVLGVQHVANAHPKDLDQMRNDVIEIFSGRMPAMLDRQGQHLHQLIEQRLHSVGTVL